MLKTDFIFEVDACTIYFWAAKITFFKGNLYGCAVHPLVIPQIEQI
jgi:hypothetical protein